MWYLQLCSSFSRLFWLFGVFSVSILEKAMAPHSNTLAWRIPGTGESGGLPSMGLHRVGLNWNDLAAAVNGYLNTHSQFDFPHFFLYKSCIIIIFKGTNINRGQDYLWERVMLYLLLNCIILKTQILIYASLSLYSPVRKVNRVFGLRFLGDRPNHPWIIASLS